MELYTAVGKAIGSQEQKLILQIGQRELVADQQESITWLFLNWKIYSKEMLTGYLAQQYPQLAEGRSYEDCLNRMVQRGILAKGSGQHPDEAHSGCLRIFLYCRCLIKRDIAGARHSTSWGNIL